MALIARSAALLPLLAALAAMPAAAQAPLVTERLDSGTVVRLRLRDGALERGRLLAPFGRDTAALALCPWPGLPCAAGDERRVRRPSAEVLGIEVHHGTAWKAGAILGALLGVPLGLSLAELRYGDDEGGTTPVTTSQRVRTAAATSVGFALLGAMIGEFFQIWRPAP